MLNVPRLQPPHILGQGQQPRGATPCPRSVPAAWRTHHTPEVRGSSWEEQSQVQGVVDVQGQEGREELLHIQGQEGQL